MINIYSTFSIAIHPLYSVICIFFGYYYYYYYSYYYYYYYF